MSDDLYQTKYPITLTITLSQADLIALGMNFSNDPVVTPKQAARILLVHLMTYLEELRSNLLHKLT